MIWALLSAGAIAAASIWICTRLARELREERRDHKASVEALAKKLKEREELLARIREANNEAAEKKDSLHHGTDAERFDKSKNPRVNNRSKYLLLCAFSATLEGWFERVP